MLHMRTAVSVTALLLWVSSAHAQVSGTWAATGSMTVSRANATATVLPNGLVLVAGGSNLSGGTAVGELYSPLTGAWTATGSMHMPRSVHNAVLLPNGKVLVVGGCTTDCNSPTPTAELYDPASGTWSMTGSMSMLRYYFSATLLATGKVLVTGGCNQTSCNTVTGVSELYDPATGQWTRTGSLATPRDFQTATLLVNGTVLIAGGFTTAGSATSAEVYDPATGKWSTTGSMTVGRSEHSATLLGNGQVLVAGGIGGTGGLLFTAEVYNPATGRWTATGSMTFRRQTHTATLLQNGKVLVAGGFGKSTGRTQNDLASAELYDPASGTFSATGNMTATRNEHIAVRMQNGRVLAAGGLGKGVGYQSSAEVYTQ